MLRDTYFAVQSALFRDLKVEKCISSNVKSEM